MEPDSSDELPEPSTESAPAPETPRLGILHLMVLTASIALHVGTMQWLRLAFPSELTQINEMDLRAVWAITAGAIAHGAAMAGLILFAARRLRGMPFPIHPGEFLIIMLGIGAVGNLPLSAFSFWLMQEMDSPRFNDLLQIYYGVNYGMLVIHAAWWIWALVRLKTRRWRLFLLSMPVCHVLVAGGMALVLTQMGVRYWQVLLLQPPMLISVVLGIVVLRDHAKGLRYPWTHWLGVAVYFWSGAAMIINGVVKWLS